ncbi:Gfo/Idh/MocA family oxidoreductase [Geitlerinema sp. PCC 9228]|uniref:Gfo/Idh/MocA family protein n=1 Tax=Geitlerinema sp. PCC 9228 TaxID=111611 RepID=UPI0008F9C661|nr:Gfo/Idh/MocA family oxidoreductase [Geitlerinema sp. PCC 9228]
MTHPVRLAILGAGRWGTHLVRNFLAHPQVQLVAVVDRQPARLDQLREKFPLPDDLLLTTDWAAVNAAGDAVAIATPASTHYNLVKEALEADLHVLVEKPLTLEPETSRQLCQLASDRGCYLMVDHTYLFHPAVQKGKQIVQSGTLGDWRYGYSARTHLGPVRQDVDALWDLAIHDLVIFNTWLGEKPSRVQAQGKNWLPANGGSPQSDLVWVTLTYPSGVTVWIHLCWFNPDKQRRLCLLGSRGTLIFNEMLPQTPLTIQRGYVEATSEGWQPAGQQQEVIDVPSAEPLKQVCDRFIAGVRGETGGTISTGWLGMELVETLTALTASLKQQGKEMGIDACSHTG